MKLPGSLKKSNCFVVVVVVVVVVIVVDAVVVVVLLLCFSLQTQTKPQEMCIIMRSSRSFYNYF